MLETNSYIIHCQDHLPEHFIKKTTQNLINIKKSIKNTCKHANDVLGPISEKN